MSDDAPQHAVLLATHTDIVFPGELEPETAPGTLIPPTADRRYPLVDEVCAIGRLVEQVRVRGGRIDVSRNHATIRREGQRYLLEDHSKFGTFVNRQRIDGPRELQSGDVIGFAHTPEMLRFENPGQAAQVLENLLTARELDILLQVAAGKTNKEIADALIISLNTVKAHLKSIFDKLEAGNRTLAVKKARERGLIAGPRG